MLSYMDRLKICRITQIAVPTGGGMKEGLDFLINPARMKEVMKEAGEWTADAILAIRQANDADPEWTDEQVAKIVVDAVVKNV